MATRASIQLVRNATLVINYAGKKILVDPMLMPKDSFDPLAGKARNPMVDLPSSIEEIVKDVDLVLVTHTHPDHFDTVAIQTLSKSIKLINQPADEEYFRKESFINSETLQDSTVWNGITIHRTGGEHGSGEILKQMGTVSGFVLKAESQPTIYIAGDTIWIDEVEQAIKKYRPDYIVTNSGGAAFPGFEATPILKDEEQTMSLIQESGEAKVIAVHMDALDHCRTTRNSLREKANELNIGENKLLIPQDGEVIVL
ncbi:MBL fold metallo-hydrolase [Pontibacter sp. KCTC 32443]|uniref:MBL fold metallo-hydrolase n=1 Tax=Pontibacter TaxID=323449 RepID=UPI00164DA874|nr:MULTISPECIES: MBL fold metallo-hydrolase [Pontibacter]MBC5773673.1 MBL fold metallo-hydrolase [Pontibacter sp. KCTC 32443]